MKTVGPMNAKQPGDTEIALIFSIDPKELHKVLMAGDEKSLDQAITEFMTREIENSSDALFEAIKELVMIRQASIAATGT